MITSSARPRVAIRVAVVTVAISVITVLALPAPQAQGLDNITRGRVRSMLNQIRDAIKKDYYDPSYHGLDVDAHFARAASNLEKATSLGYAYSVIAQALLDFNDSHTFFIPASRSSRVAYGWLMQMVGDRCLVTSVNPRSDASAKGLKAGDQILSVGNLRPSRRELWKIKYFYYTLNPVAAIRLTVQDAGGQPRQVEISTKVTAGKRLRDLTGGDGGFDLIDFVRALDDTETGQRFWKSGSTLFWKMPDFQIEPGALNDLLDDKLKGVESLVIDLRGNGGGYLATLEELVGRFFDRDVKIADPIGRRPQDVKPLVAKKRKGKPFEGTLVVLIDGESASAAELFARVMQIEKRAKVVGDQSSGSVMAATEFEGQMGVDKLVLFGASITRADLVMSDGRSLERVGVQPDEILLPTAEDLAASRDPVLTRAAALAGAELDPVQAGKIFRVEWKQ
jgi:C-terminal processing protease CtpA/Prc